MTPNPLLSLFPIDSKIIEIRPNQTFALNEIWKAIESGEKKITLSAPVGSGKSKIAETIIRYFQSQGKKCLYQSPLNSLVDQVETVKHINSGIITLKGRRYYPCIAKGNDIKCDMGYCTRKICYVTRNSDKEHRVKRNCRDCQLADCICRHCEYKKVFRRYREADSGNTNSSLWLLGITPKDYSILVIDEVDSMEEFMRMNYTVSVSYHVLGDFQHHINVAGDYADKIESCIDCDKDYDCIPRNISRLESKIESIRNMTNDYEEHHEEWIIRKEINKSGEPRTRYEPVTVTRFTEPLLKDLDFVLAMSATPPRWEGYRFIEVPSPFPIDIRQCYYKPLGRFNKDSREANMPKLAGFLVTLKGKTLVHCNSYSFAGLLADTLRKQNIYPLLQVRDNGNNLDDDSTSRYDAINAFITAKDPNKIYLSVNMGRGIDLWQPEIQNNVIAVVPWSDPTDLLTIAKTKLLGESWKNENTAILIEQEHGRIHRGIYYLKDIIKTRPDLSWLPVNSQGMIVKRTFITDSNFNNGKGRLIAWYQRNRRYFSNSFNEVMRL